MRIEYLIFILRNSNTISVTTKQVDDYGNDMTSAEDILVDTLKNGRIDYAGDVDYFRFTPSVDGCYAIYSTGSTDIYGNVYNSLGEEIATPNDDNGIGDRNFKIVEGFEAGKTYYIKVSYYNNIKTGAYNLKIENTNSDEVNLADLLHEAGGTRSGKVISLNLYGEIKSSRNIGIRTVNGKEVVYIDEFSYELVPTSIIQSKLIALENLGYSVAVVKAQANSIHPETYGNQNANVKDIQLALKTAECWIEPNGTSSNSPITGYYGDITRASVIKYQTDQNKMNLTRAEIFYPGRVPAWERRFEDPYSGHIGVDKRTAERLTNELPGAPTVTLISPTTGSLYNGTITITAIGTSCDHIAAFVNDVCVAVQNGNNFSYNYTVPYDGTYKVYVKARNVPGSSGGKLVASGIATVQGRKSEQSFTDTEAPTWESGSAILIPSVTTSNVTLYWPYTDDNFGVSQYVIYKDNVAIATVSSDTHTYTIYGLNFCSWYNFRVEAKDDAGHISNNGPSTNISAENTIYSSFLSVDEDVHLSLEEKARITQQRKFQNEFLSEYAGSFSWLDALQLGLDLLGMVPVIGEPVDGANACIYMARGDEVNAALSAGSMVPIAGWISTGGKLAGKSIKALGKIVRAEKVINDLASFSSKYLRYGDKTFLIDKRGMKHILERHHPDYWDGSGKSTQTFLDKNMTIDDVVNTIEQVMQQNRETLINQGTTGMYRVKGIVNGKTYVVGFSDGRVGQFYPE